LDAHPAHSPERRGILSGETQAADHLIRLVRDPDGRIVPDIAHKLPGRGAWLDPDRARLETLIGKRKLAGALARAFKSPVTADQIPADLPQMIDRLLLKRCLDRLGLERKAGRLTTGFDAVADRLKTGAARILLHATDAGADGVAKLGRLTAPDMPVIRLFSREEMSLALGRDNVVHAALDPGGGADRLLADARRLAFYRGLPAPDRNTNEDLEVQE